MDVWVGVGSAPHGRRCWFFSSLRDIEFRGARRRRSLRSFGPTVLLQVWMLRCAVWPFLHSFENWYRFVFKVFGDGLIAVPSATYGCLGLIGSASWLSSLAMNSRGVHRIIGTVPCIDVIRFFVFRSGWLS